MSDEENVSLPAHLQRLIENRLEAEALPAHWQRTVAAEILPGYQPQLVHPLYDDLLLLAIRFALFGAARDMPRQSTELRQTIQQTNHPEQAANLWLQQEAEDLERRIWTAFAPPITSAGRRLLESGKLKDFLEILEEMVTEEGAVEEDETDEPEIASGPVGYDRLPQELIEFIVEEFDASRVAGPAGITKETWRIVQDRLYPHFVAERLDDDDYREFLATLALYHAFGVRPRQILDIIREEEQLLRDALRDAENLPASAAEEEKQRIGFLLQKYTDFGDEIRFAQAVKRRRGGEPDTNPFEEPRGR